MRLICCLLLVVLPSAMSQKFKGNCPKQWKDITPQHTMCIDGDLGKAVKVDAKAITDYTNKKRGGVSPAASDMWKVYWDDDVAEVAAKWARQCSRYGPHDNNDARKMQKFQYVPIGQNMASGYSSWEGAIDGWYDEVNNFAWGKGTTDPSKPVGHYTQLVSSDVFKIGCGQADCDGTPYYICNYVTGTHSNEPYTQGKKCGSCPKSCKDGLCDCKGLACMYQSEKGDECSCKCQPNMGGKDCSQVELCGDDAVMCPQVPEQYCSFLNSGAPGKVFFRYQCPKKCKVCS